MIFSKYFLPQNLRKNNAKLIQKTERKKVEYFRSYDRKTISDQPSSGAILSQHEKTSSTIFFHFQHKHNAEKRLKKYSVEKKVTAH
jgi:hypothetical protein